MSPAQARQEPVKVAVADLAQHRAYRVRHSLSEPVVRQYANVIRNGVPMRPITVALVNGAAVVVDGHYRVEAHKRLGLPSIDAVFVEATRDEVQWMAAEANLTHGEKLKPREVRTAFRAFIAARRHLSDRLRMAWPDAGGGDSSSGCGPETPEAGWPSLAERQSAIRLT